MLIQDNQCLTQYVPNTLKAVAGESSLFDKIAPQLALSEQWLTSTFLSEKVRDALTDDDAIMPYARMAIAADAMLHVVPQLDLVLTSNGFGIVSTSAIAPASKERIERLLAALEKQRDDALAVLLPLLAANAAWVDSSPYEYFAATLFPMLDIVTTLGYNDHIWQRYQEIHAQLLPIEQRLAADHFSPELMDYLRRVAIRSEWSNTPDSGKYQNLYRRITSIEFSILRIGEYPMPSITDAVNYIRSCAATVFPLWHTSDTAKLYGMQNYQNKKGSAGYFF